MVKKQGDQAFEKHLKPRPEVSLALFGFLFSEIVQHFMKKEKEAAAARSLLDPEALARAPPLPDLERELFETGKPIGERILELQSYRDKGSGSTCNSAKREVKVVNMLHFLNQNVWKTLFGRPADGLEQSVDDEDEYRILDKQPITNTFVSHGSS